MLINVNEVQYFSQHCIFHPLTSMTAELIRDAMDFWRIRVGGFEQTKKGSGRLCIHVLRTTANDLHRSTLDGPHHIDSCSRCRVAIALPTPLLILKTAIATFSRRKIGGTGVRYHKIGDSVSPAHVAWPGKSGPRMDAGVPGVEFKAHGHIAPKLRSKRVK